ncbi:hypothetical protein [Synechococcus sp. RedBA-s]|uniref:hypothetical protein n=1 Tax=Synechococcus sp. RedBA-s TaxID=2823741 RepID=UPI0020CDA64F|nr:hypothetical protein [Synechococcus sp. RedBA-s]MCP9801929.1 hypothetical protein [Synechococcus sp. RedBA-s]
MAVAERFPEILIAISQKLQQNGENTALPPSKSWPTWMTGRLFFQTLSFDALEVLALVEDAGSTPSEVDAAVGFGNRHTAELFGALVRHGLLDWVGRDGKPGTMPDSRRFTSTTSQLTPLARSLRHDQNFSLKAFGASLGTVYEGNCG